MCTLTGGPSHLAALSIAAELGAAFKVATAAAAKRSAFMVIFSTPVLALFCLNFSLISNLYEERKPVSFRGALAAAYMI